MAPGFSIADESRPTITLPNSPAAFRGTTEVLLSDIHHGPFVPLVNTSHVVDMVKSLKPDLVLLTGDYILRSFRFITPGIKVLGTFFGQA